MVLSKEKIYNEIMNLPKNDSLVEYASKFIELSKEGTRYIGRCPFCYQQNRLTIFADNNKFHCFWCSKGGETLQFRNLLLELFEYGSSDLKYNPSERAIRKRSREIIIENLTYTRSRKTEPIKNISWNESYYQYEDEDLIASTDSNSNTEDIQENKYSSEELYLKSKLEVGVKVKYSSNEIGVIIEKTEKTITIKYPTREMTLDIGLAIKSKGLKIL